jgi:hypothetical protein
MFSKNNLVAFFVLTASCSSAQKIIFSGNFENKRIDSSWQIVTGNWHIADVQEMGIAPAEGGYQYVLCSGGNGHIGDNIISLIVDLPDSIRSKKIRISFSYYILANAAGTKIEGEFYQKEIKDGLRGKPWVADLFLKKGRWTVFQKILTIPAGANSVRMTFFGLESSGKTDRIVCFDNIIISSLK